MRWLLALIVVAVMAAPAAASPKFAAVLLDGDSSSGQLTGVVTEEAAKHGSVVDSELVTKEMRSLGLDGVPEGRDLKHLRARLKADVMLTGKVAKSGSKLKLTLTVTGRSGKAETFSVVFTKSSSPVFRKDLAAAIQKHATEVTSTATSDDDDDEDGPKKPPPPVVKEKDKDKDDDAPKPVKHETAKVEKDKDKSDDDVKKPTKPVKKVAKVDSDDGDSDDPDALKTHRRGHRSSLENSRNLVTQASLFLDGGAAGVRRTLTYTAAASGTPPPRVGTAGFTPQVDGAYYLGDGASGIGVVGTVRQTVGLSIAVPNTTVATPIDEALYTLGVRYRIAVAGDSSLSFGANYWRYRYIANRKALGDTPGALDMPDVDYSAFAPGGELKYALSKKSALYGSVLVPIVLSSGPLTTGMGGKGTFGVAVDAGLDVALGDHYGLRFDALFDQIGIKFESTNTTAQMRGLSAATDRSLGLAATFCVLY